MYFTQLYTGCMAKIEICFKTSLVFNILRHRNRFSAEQLVNSNQGEIGLLIWSAGKLDNNYIYYTPKEFIIRRLNLRSCQQYRYISVEI